MRERFIDSWLWNRKKRKFRRSLITETEIQRVAYKAEEITSHGGDPEAEVSINGTDKIFDDVWPATWRKE